MSASQGRPTSKVKEWIAGSQWGWWEDLCSDAAEGRCEVSAAPVPGRATHAATPMLSVARTVYGHRASLCPVSALLVEKAAESLGF